MKKSFKFKVGTLSGSCISGRHSLGNMIRGGELFQIVNRGGSQRYSTYKVKGYAREPINGTFYEEELCKRSLLISSIRWKIFLKS